MLNAILSGSAERGDIDRVVSILDEFPRNNLKPDADSFSFAMEALGKNLAKRTLNPPGVDDMAECLEHSSTFLSMMEEAEIAPTHHIIRNYVELLCRTHEVETATDVILEQSSKDVDGGGESEGAPSTVDSKAIHCVATSNVRIGNYDAARKVALCRNGQQTLPSLLEWIDSEERHDRINQWK